MKSRLASWIGVGLIAAAAPVAGCAVEARTAPPPAAPAPDAVPPDSPLARIHPDMGTQEVSAILGPPYDMMEYTTGKQFIPFYSTWGGDTYRVAWRYRGIGRVILTRPHAYTNELRVLKVEYDPNEGGGAPPPPAVAAEAPPPPASAAPADTYDDADPSALTDFRPTLDPYGHWAEDPTYGTVWVPAVGPDFVPYSSGGHWVHDDDWVWVSDYEWGAIPFHYGRWVFLDGRGWAWIPGREYRGAWVNWQVDDGYTTLGWAPAPPEFVWRGGAPVTVHVDVGPRWVYVPRAEIFSPAVGTRVMHGPAAVSIGARMHVLAPERPGVRPMGPPPDRFGYAPDRVPRPSGLEQAKLVRAQQMAHPATAQALGGHPPARGLATRGPAGPGGAPAGAPPAGIEAHGAPAGNHQLMTRGPGNEAPRPAPNEGLRPAPNEGLRPAPNERPELEAPHSSPRPGPAEAARPMPSEGARPPQNPGNLRPVPAGPGAHMAPAPTRSVGGGGKRR